MRAEGIEPPRPLGHEHLKLACLPKSHHARVARIVRPIPSAALCARYVFRMRTHAEVESALSLVALGQVRRGRRAPDRDPAKHGAGLARWARCQGETAPGPGLAACPICRPESMRLPEREYAYLLGLYLGDAVRVQSIPRTYCLRIFLQTRSTPGSFASATGRSRLFPPSESSSGSGGKSNAVATW